MNSYNTIIFPPLSIKVISTGTTARGYVAIVDVDPCEEALDAFSKVVVRVVNRSAHQLHLLPYHRIDEDDK
jgi:hypothetical protein